MRRLVRRYALWTVSLVVISAVPYVLLMCPLTDAHGIAVAMIEAFNYSVQTVTTVGYGNWAPADAACGSPVTVAIPFTAWSFSGLLALKFISIFFMLAGAGVFAITVGLAVEWIKS